MKFSKVASLCKAHKSITIYDAPNGEQWIGVDGSAYRMSGMPTINENTALVMLDVPADKIFAWHCVKTELPPQINFNDYGDETHIEREPMNIQWYGDEFTFFTDGGVIHAVKMELLKPLLGEDEEYMTFHKRQTDSGQFMLAVKIAMELKAIIAPFNLIRTEEAGVSEGGEYFFTSLRNIARLYADMPVGGYENRRWTQHNRADTTQNNFKMNEETGEAENA
jgi:hypothetical protein